MMKNIPNITIVLEKARSICKMIDKEYEIGDVKLNISISIGIALYPEHGTTFEQLYYHSDEALYKVKNEGKNNIYLYEQTLIESNKEIKAAKDVVKKPDSYQHLITIGNYIFKILYSATDFNKAINAVFELLRMHFDMEQGVIIVKNVNNGDYNTNNSLKYQVKIKNNLIELFNSNNFEQYLSLFNHENILWIDNIKAFDKFPSLSKIYQDTNIETLVQGLIKNGDELIAIISIEYQNVIIFSNKNKNKLLIIIALISTFMIQQYQNELRKQYEMVPKKINYID